MTDLVEIAALPGPLRWRERPEQWQRAGDDALVVRAGARTDLFTDPGGEAPVANAPALMGRVDGDFMLSARVSADLTATYDAAALLLFVDGQTDGQTWAKLCLERSPQGQPMIVSVVTRGVSDDCNSFPVDGTAVGPGGVQLRISRLGPAFAFHVRTGGAAWQLVRYFALGGEPEVGFLAQSPLGDGCTVRFEEITYAAERLADLRGGA